MLIYFVLLEQNGFFFLQRKRGCGASEGLWNGKWNQVEEHEMETIIQYIGLDKVYIGIIEKKLETTI